MLNLAMNTQNPTIEINEAAVNAWLRGKRALLDKRGMSSVTLMITTDEITDWSNFCGANCYDSTNTFQCERGSTVDEAFAKLRAKVPLSAVAQLRKQAALLMAEADVMEKGGAT